MELTPAALDNIATLLSALGIAPVGVAACPQVSELIKHAEGQACKIPIQQIVDPRLSRDITEVYYDREQWHARCEEQRKWDDAYPYSTPLV